MRIVPFFSFPFQCNGIQTCAASVCARVLGNPIYVAFSVFFSVVAVAVSICEDDRKLHKHRMNVHVCLYERISKWILAYRREENGMSSRVKTNYDHHERERIHTTHSSMLLIMPPFYCQIYMNCAVLSLSVDRHIKLPSMCRIVCFINTHISFNRQVKLHLFSCLCLHSKMHSQIQANAHTNCNRLKQKHMFKAFARDKFCRWLFSLRVVFGENSLRPLFESELFKYRNSVRDFCVDINLFTNVGKYSFSDYWVWACAFLTTRRKKLEDENWV